jgi:oxygen-dependent protoporphyrinogen oxidase
LVQALTAQLQPDAVQTNSAVLDFEYRDNRWRLACPAGTHEFEGVVLATPAYASAQLLNSASPKAARLLRGIPYNSSATIVMGYDVGAKDADKLRAMKGFGFLVPHKEGHRALACTFVHNKFPNRVSADRALLRIFFGGVRDEEVVRLSDQELLGLARAELKSLLNLELEPLFWRIHRWSRAMPQYNVGHGELVREVITEVSQLANLALAGNAYGGIGISDCVRQGKEAAVQVAGVGKDGASAT